MSRSKGKNRIILWGTGILGLGALALSASPKARRTMVETVETGMDWMEKVIRRVSAHEGSYDSLNLNSDGAGLSFGILQWSQRTGALGELLREMHLTDPGRFAAIFGPSYHTLLELTGRGSLDPLEGAPLWQAPWVARFRIGGQDPAFRAVQDRLATNGQYMQAAITAAQTLGITTERSLALTYDTAVQQGPGFARQLAGRVRHSLAGRLVTHAEILRSFAELGPVHFRAFTAPTKPHPKKGLDWRSVGPGEWHVFAGKVDLYTNIRRRRLALVNDPYLSDLPVPLPAQAVV